MLLLQSGNQTRTGERMREKIQVLELNMDHCSAKEAMQEVATFMETEYLNVIELVTIETLLYAKDQEEFRRKIELSDMVIPCHKDILEAAGIYDKKEIQEIEQKTFLSFFLKYFHKNHFRVYFLGKNEEELKELVTYISTEYKGIQIVGQRVTDGSPDKDDNLVNDMNGSEPDCIIADLPFPIQEELVARTRNQIASKVWLGAGGVIGSMNSEPKGKRKLASFLSQLFFRREIRKKIK